jgi:NAD(P)-dependent dehydrogenase (short-subunit alcohol dehydrogenase family)
VRLKGKAAFVTGAASGLGRAIAAQFADEGAMLAITDINEKGLQEFAVQLRNGGAQVLDLKHDVSKEEDWLEVIRLTMERFGKIDIVVNNAGVGIHGNVETTTFDGWKQVMNTNLDSVFLGTKYGAQAMISKGNGGSIINMSSIAGMVGDSELLAYSASKGGVRLLTKSAAIHLAKTKTGIRVNSIHPGYIDTPLSGLIPYYEEIVAAHPVGHFGNPMDIAHAAVYLASDDSQFMTGSELVIDGGYTAQ